MIIRDVMPAFELYQPTQLQGCLRSARPLRQGCLEDGGRLRQPVVVQGPHQTAEGRDRPLGHRRDEGHPRDRRRRSRSARSTTLTDDRAQPGHQGQVPRAGRRRQPRWRARRSAINGTHRRQRLAGCALPLLSLRPALLPGRRQRLLRRYAGRRQPRARAVRHRPLRGGEPVRHRAGAGRARCEVRDPQLQGRAGDRRRGILHRSATSTSPA